MTTAGARRSGNQPELRPIVAQSNPPTWPGATWIGEIDVAESGIADSGIAHSDIAHCGLAGATGYPRARLLVRDGQALLGYVTLAVVDGGIDGSALREAIAELPAREPQHSGTDRPPLTVVVCTRNRPAMLANAIEAILASDYPDFRVIVVDNASSDRSTVDYVEALADPRVSVVEEPRPGLSRARNTGLLRAETEIVVFTDDDVIVDRHWLTPISTAFASDPTVACVTGNVPTAELRTPTQAYFDSAVNWADQSRRRSMSMANPPHDLPLFPFTVGRFGTGANFAVRRSVLIELGGFDEALGAGAPTGGGEDLDIFLRVLVAGYTLVKEPASLVWHIHRDTLDDLTSQADSYGVGLGAMLLAMLFIPGVAWLAVKTAIRRLPALLRTFREAPDKYRPGDDVADTVPAEVGKSMYTSIVRGPGRYIKALRQGRARRPLAASAAK